LADDYLTLTCLSRDKPDEKKDSEIGSNASGHNPARKTKEAG